MPQSFTLHVPIGLMHSCTTSWT